MSATATKPKKPGRPKKAATYEDAAMDRKPLTLPSSPEFYEWLTADERDDLHAAAKRCRAHHATHQRLQAAVHELIGDDSLTIAELNRRAAEVRAEWLELQAERLELLWLVRELAVKYSPRAAEFVKHCEDSYDAELVAIREEFAAQGVTADAMQAGLVNPEKAKHQFAGHLADQPKALASMGRINRGELLAAELANKARTLPHSSEAAVSFPQFDGKQLHLASAIELAGDLPQPGTLPELPANATPEEKSIGRIVERIHKQLAYDRYALLPEHFATLRELAQAARGPAAATSPRPLLHVGRESRPTCRELLAKLPPTPEFREIIGHWNVRDSANQ